MKRLLKVLLVIIGIVVLVLTGLMIFISNKSPEVFENKAPDVTVTPDSAKVAEGARMASLLCVNCHGGEDGTLSGHFMPDTKVFGTLYAPNITHHENSRLHGYTDGELMYLFRTGIKKDGLYAPPWMPKFPHLSDYDVECLISFLRSDNPMLKGSDVVQPAPEPSFLAKALTTFVFKPLPYPTEAIPQPNQDDPVEFGKYLAVAKFDCYGCHSEDFATLNTMEPEKSPGFFGGGNNLLRKDGTPIISPNITMDETGIGNWTEDQFVTCVRYGERPSGIATQYPMVPFSNMTEKEVKAIWAYLQTVPKIKRENPKS